MVVLEVRFLSGRFHATPWGEHVNSGVVEWPPAPWRVLRAIVSAGLREEKPDFDTMNGVVRALSQENPTYHSPTIALGHWRSYLKDPRPRENPSLVHDTFVSVGSPERPLYIEWPAVTLDALERGWLARAVHRLSYLGRSESLCAIRLVDAEVQWSTTDTQRIPPEQLKGRGEVVRLLAPTPATQLADLMMTTDEMRGTRRRREPPHARYVDYERPPELVNAASSAPPRGVARGSPTEIVAARYLLTGALLPSLWDTVHVGQVFRSTANAKYARLSSGLELSPVLSGHIGDAKLRGHGHAHYLPQALGGDRLRIDHVLVWAPDGFTTVDISALTQVHHLFFPGYLEMAPAAAALLGLLTRTELAQELAAARTWTSVTPFVPARHMHARRGADGSRVYRDTPESEVRQELRRRHLPDPVEVSIEPGDPTMVRFSRPNLRSTTALPGAAGVSPRQHAGAALKVTISFPVAVTGPLALGQWAHIGLGVFQPAEK